MFLLKIYAHKPNMGLFTYMQENTQQLSNANRCN